SDGSPSCTVSLGSILLTSSPVTLTVCSAASFGSTPASCCKSVETSAAGTASAAAFSPGVTGGLATPEASSTLAPACAATGVESTGGADSSSLSTSLGDVAASLLADAPAGESAVFVAFGAIKYLLARKAATSSTITTTMNLPMA